MRVLLATVAGAITLFVLGYLIWGMLLASYFKDNEIQYAGLSKQPAPSLVSFFLSNLALLFCWRLFSINGHQSEHLSVAW
jgi:hypothetical protein